MILMKKEWNLGVLIAACCTGGFVLLFMLYLWAVTTTLFQMIGVVSSKEYQERLLEETTPHYEKMKKNSEIVAISQASNFAFSNDMLSRDFSEFYRKNYMRT